jgi:hypothetical protein
MVSHIISGGFKTFPVSLLERYKTVPTFKLHFLVQLYTSASKCEGVGNIPESHFVKAFSALLSHSE